MSAANVKGWAPEVAEIITRDCGYGFSGHAVTSDGTCTAYTATLHPTREQAAAEVRESLASATGDQA